MTTTNFNIRLDSDLKERTFPIIERFGLTPAQAVKLFFNQIAETDTIPLSFDYPARIDSQKIASHRLRQSIEQVQNGDTQKFDDLNDFLGAFGIEKAWNQ